MENEELHNFYTLSLTIGRTTDFVENCSNFLNKLLELKKLDYASIWIRGNFLKANPDSDKNFYLQYATSENFNNEIVITPYHPINNLLKENQYFISSSNEDKNFQYLILEQYITKGQIIVFNLGDCGFFKLYTKKEDIKFNDETLCYLLEIIDHFKVSIERDLYFNKAFVESRERKYMQESLEEKDALHKNIVENLHEGVIITDLVDRIIYTNKKFEKLTGYQYEEIKGEQIYEIIFPETNQEIMKEKINLGQNQSSHYELQFLDKNNNTHTGSFSSTPYTTNNNTLLGTITVVTDITQKKKDREENENLAKFHSENPFPVFRVEESGKISFTNEAANEILQQWGIISEKNYLSGALFNQIYEYKDHKKIQETTININNKVYELSFVYIHEKKYFNVYGKEITEIYKTREALKNNEEKFRLVSENSRDLIGLHKPDGTYEYISPSVKDIVGYKPEELIGRNPYDIFINKDIQEKVVDSHNKALKNNKDNKIEYRINRKDGKSIWLETITQPIFDEEGNIIRLQTTSRDITEKKITEQKLIRSQANLRAAINGTPLNTILFDAEGYVILVNKNVKDNALKTLGYHIEEGTNIFNIIPQYELENFNKNFSRALNGEKLNFEREIKFPGKDNTIWANCIYEPVATDNQTVGVVFSIVEITARKNAEIQLKKEREFFNRIMETSVAAIIVFNKKGKITFANNTAQNILGYDKTTLEQSIYNDPGWHITNYDNTPITDEELPFNKVKNSGKSLFDMPMALKGKDGKRKFLTMNGAPLWDKNNNIESLVFSIKDVTEKVQAEKALKKSEKRYRSLVETASDIIYKASPKGYFKYANPIALRIVEYSANQLYNKHFTELIRKDYQSLVINFYNYQIRKKIASTYYEFPVITKSGKERWLGQNVQLIIDENEIIELSAVARDITDRKKTEEKLIRTSSRLTTLIENLQSGILVINETNQVQVTNQIFCNMFGIEEFPENLIGKDRHEVHDNNLYKYVNEYDEFKKKTDKILNDKKIIAGEEIQLNDGRIIERDYVPIFNNNEYMGHLWQYNDITQRVKSARDLEESERRQRALLSAIPDLILRMDQQGNYLDVNVGVNSPVMESENLQGINIWQTSMPEDTKSLIYNTIQKALKTNEMQYIEFKLPKNNEMKFYEERIVKSSETEVICTVRDITERKLSEHALIEARKRAEESSRSKEAFLANMSHEIRTPMNAIVGMSRLLQKTSLNSEQKEYLNAIHASSDNLLVIINDILDISKIEAGKLNIENIGFNLHQLIENIVNSIRYKTEEKELLLNYHIDNDIADILIGDPYRLNQILLNLVNNAIKFTNKGNVSIKCSLNNDNNIKDNINRITFEVSDTGIGIEKKKLKSIFESFNQEDTSTTRKYGGTGLGLAITRKLVNLFGGEIYVNSKKNKGSTFYFTIDLPVGNKNDLPQENEISKEDINLKNIKVLLAEDHKFNQLLAISILKEHKVDLILAENGKETVEIAKNNSFDIILMDIQMPELNGVEATEYIRKTLNINVPVIALTANARKGDQEKYINYGMNDYISKPFDPDNLVRKINHWVNNQKTELKEETSDQQIYESDVNENGNMEKDTNGALLYSTDKLLKSFGNNTQMVNQMLDSFIESSEEILKNMNENFEKNNLQKVGSLAHKLKPSIDIIDITSLKEEIRVLESLSKAEEKKEEIMPVLQKVTKTMNEVINQIKEHK